MRRVRYSVASSLDGYIAGPDGEYDWIPIDPDMDFAEMMKSNDTILMGRKSYEISRSQISSFEGMNVYVFSRTLEQEECPGVVVSADAAGTVASLRQSAGKDIWLFGGGSLFSSLLAAGLVDDVEVGIIPILLGGGIPLLSSPAKSARLELKRQRVYEKTGTVLLEYALA